MRLDLLDVLFRPFATRDFLLRRLFCFLSHAKLLVWSSGLLPHIKCVASYVIHSEYELARRRYYIVGKASTRDSAGSRYAGATTARRGILGARNELAEHSPYGNRCNYVGDGGQFLASATARVNNEQRRAAVSKSNR